MADHMTAGVTVWDPGGVCSGAECGGRPCGVPGAAAGLCGCSRAAAQPVRPIALSRLACAACERPVVPQGMTGVSHGNRYQLTLITSFLGGLVAGYASRLQPEGAQLCCRHRVMRFPARHATVP